MSKQGRTKLVSPDTKSENQVLETLEKLRTKEKSEEPVITELDNEIECPRCNDVMELHSSFDKLVYTCDSCSFLLRCV
jgi:late competence protein required for DNA uptake (superfamily II DNA/RNA helicase)